MVLDLNNKIDGGGGLVQEGHGTRSQQQDGCSGGQGMGAGLGAARAGECEWAKLRQLAGWGSGQGGAAGWGAAAG